MLGLIHVGPDVGFGVYGVLCPALSHVTQRHLEQLPATVREEFPQAQSIALAGRLPGLLTAAGEGYRAWALGDGAHVCSTPAYFPLQMGLLV
jgi:hypothetical protein